MRRKLLRIVRNPLVLIPPLILLLAVGWHQYTYAGRNFSLPNASNVFPGSDFASFNADGLPVGWQVHSNSAASYRTEQTDGYASRHSFELTVSNYQSGALSAISPKVNLAANTTYLFKGYYTTSTPLVFLARYFYSDGSSSLQFIESYPAAAGSWSTTSDAFKTGSNITAVQFVYRLHGNGTLELNDLYLEPSQQVYTAPQAAGKNLVPNSDFVAGAYDAPADWSTYQGGNNTASFAYDQATDGAYVETTVSGYKNGEAKWQYAPQPVTGHQYYQFSVDYRSNAAIPVVAEFTLDNGQRQDITIGELQPADDWTHMTYHLETPPNATTLFVAAPLQNNGTIDSRNYELINITRPGAAHWSQPVVSITFDDGWQSSYDNALPLLQNYGYKASFYINPANIETPNFMTAGELSALSNTGNEIGAHGYDHDDLTSINAGTLEYQLHEGRDYLRSAGFSVTDAATPYGRSDPEVQWYARKYFTTLRSTDTGVNTRQNIDPYNLKVLYINNQTSSQTITDALRQAKDYDGWLILVYHRVGGPHNNPASVPTEESSTTSIAEVKQQLNLVHKSGIRVLPVAAAYAELEQP